MEATTELPETTGTHLPYQDDDNDPEKEPLFMIPVYVVIMLLILIGNGLFMAIIVLTRQSLAITYIFFMSLATADFLVGLFVIPATIYGLAKDVHSGLVQCNFLPFSQLLSVAASIGSLLFICIDRYRIVVLQWPQWKKTEAIRIVAGIWISSAVYSTRHFVQQAIRHSHLEEDKVEVCGMFIEDDKSDLWFRIVDFLVLFCIPMIAMTIMYGRVIQKLWAPMSASEVSMVHKKRVVVMCVVIVVSFFVCWLPWHLTDIIADTIEALNKEEDEEKEVAISVQVAIFTTALPLINSFTSPVIYASFSPVFRGKMIEVMTCKKCRGKIVALDEEMKDEDPSIAVTNLQQSVQSTSQYGT